MIKSPTIYAMEFVRRAWHWLVDLAETLAIAGAIFFIIYAFLLRPFQVNGTSMFPTFINNEFVFTNLLSQRFGQLKRGDVIVFKAPPSEDKDYIKRIIGLPGDTIKIQDNSVYVNGKKLNESKYLSPSVRTQGRGFAHEGEEIKVPTDNYFVMGDNRVYSSDSRDWGFVLKDKIIGESAFVYWPLNRMRFVHNPFDK